MDPQRSLRAYITARTTEAQANPAGLTLAQGRGKIDFTQTTDFKYIAEAQEDQVLLNGKKLVEMEQDGAELQAGIDYTYEITFLNKDANALSTLLDTTLDVANNKRWDLVFFKIGAVANEYHPMLINFNISVEEEKKGTQKTFDKVKITGRRTGWKLSDVRKFLQITS